MKGIRLDLDDQAIKSLIVQWKSEPSEKKLIRIRDMLSSLIYAYPARVFSRSEESCSGFFEYVAERLSNMLDKYEPQEARFTTWFFIVLRNHYFNWTKSEKRQNRIKEIPLNIQTDNPDEEMDLGDFQQHRHWHENMVSATVDQEEKRLMMIQRILKSLTAQQKLVVSLLFYHLDIEALQSVYKGKRKIMDVFKEYSRINMDMKEKRDALSVKIRMLSAEITELQYKERCLLNILPKPDDLEEKLQTIRKDLAKKRRFREDRTRDLTTQNLNMPYSWVGDVIGLPAVKVRKTMDKIRKVFMFHFEKNEALI